MSLPAPDSVALATSQALCEYLRAEIDRAGGWIPFSRYMDLALFAPGLGYYAAGARKFGAQGDFVTAPELSPLFARTLARQIAPLLQESAPYVIEPGAGTGALAADVLLELERLGALPDHYDILEISPDLQDRQRSTLAQRAGHLLDRVRWLDALPERFSGVVIANEVLDAIPFERVCWTESGACLRGVAVVDDRFVSSDRPADPATQARMAKLPVRAPFVSEIHPAATAWVASWAARLERGALVLIDYGFPEREFYHPQRDEGTLMCHYRHHAHGDPFYLPGLNDITAHLDFTAIATAGVESGLELLGYTTQAHFLLNCGVLEVLSQVVPAEGVAFARAAQSVQMLTSPAEMGELFKVMALGRGIASPLVGFARHDQSHRL